MEVTILGTAVPEDIVNGCYSQSFPPGVHLYDGRTNVICNANAISRQSLTFLLFGSEGSGLDPDLLRLCDFRVTINPQRLVSNDVANNVDSLNVSVASGILLNHFLCS